MTHDRGYGMSEVTIIKPGNHFDEAELILQVYWLEKKYISLGDLNWTTMFASALTTMSPQNITTAK